MVVQCALSLGVVLTLGMRLFFDYPDKLWAGWLVIGGLVSGLFVQLLISGDKYEGADDRELAALLCGVLYVFAAVITLALRGEKWAWIAVAGMVACWALGYFLAHLANTWGKPLEWLAICCMALGLLCPLLWLPLHGQAVAAEGGWQTYVACLVPVLAYGVALWRCFNRQLLSNR